MRTTTRPALAAERVTVQRGARTILREVSLEVAAGQVVALIGPNGAGKSTLLSTLSAEREPHTGAVFVGEDRLHALTPADRARRRAVLPQHAALSFDLPVLDVVSMGRTPFTERSRVSREIAAEALEAVELRSAAKRGYLQLSGGERQRVQLARFLAHTWPDATSARVGLLDEPVASLDPRQQHRSMAVLRSLAASGCAIVIVLHDLVLASMYADRVVVMRDGAILANGTPASELSCEVLEAAFDTRFSLRVDDSGQPVVLPCLRQDALRCVGCGGAEPLPVPLARAQ